MAEAGVGKKLIRLGIQDQFLHGASRGYLMREYGMDVTALLSAVERAVGRSLLIREEDVGQVFLPAALSDAKPEAL